MSRSATLPPIRITPETKASLEAVLRKGESLTQFIENAVSQEASFRAEQDAADYIDLIERRAAAIPAYDAATSDYDAVIMPTTAIIAPRIDEVAKDDDYTRINLLILRNPMMFNILDCCSISIPMNRPGDAPTGLMVVGRSGTDRRTLAISKAIEGVLHPM